MKSSLEKASYFLLIPLFILIIGVVLAIFEPTTYHGTSSNAESLQTTSITPVQNAPCCPTNPRMGIFCSRNLQPCPSQTVTSTISVTPPCCPLNKGIPCVAALAVCPTNTIVPTTVTVTPSCCPLNMGVPCKEGEGTCVTTTLTPTVSVTPLCCPLNMGVPCKVGIKNCPPISVTTTSIVPLTGTVTPSVACCPLDTTSIACKTMAIPCPLQVTKTKTTITKAQSSFHTSQPAIVSIWNNIKNFFLHLF